MSKIILSSIVPGASIESATIGSAGIDLHLINIKHIYSTNNVKYDDAVIEMTNDMKRTGSFILPPKRRILLGTGIIIKECPINVELQVRPRSSVSLKTGLDVKLGTIDSDYIHKEIGVIAENTTDTYLHLGYNDRIAQLVACVIIPPIEISGVTVIDKEREGGFGSTDKK